MPKALLTGSQWGYRGHSPIWLEKISEAIFISQLLKQEVWGMPQLITKLLHQKAKGVAFMDNIPQNFCIDI